MIVPFSAAVLRWVRQVPRLLPVERAVVEGILLCRTPAGATFVNVCGKATGYRVNPHTPTAQLIHLGCSKNQVDSEEILGLLMREGFQLTTTGDADVVVINTCGFLQAAKEESLRVISDAARRRRRGQIGRLIVAGCLVQRCPDELGRLEGVDALVGVGQAEAVAEAARMPLLERDRRVRIVDRPLHRWRPGAPRVLSTPPWSAYLKIAEGCDHPCTFCTIPAIRGPYTSKPLDACVAEARELAATGVRELNLVAQDTTRYGHDLPGRPDLRDLIAALHAIDDLRWIRVFYAYPYHGLERLAAAMAEFPKLCRYLDIPLQHSDRIVLRAMRRPGDGSAYLDMISKMREMAQGITLRTTLIVGFPGETREAFEGLLHFVEQARFDRLGVFEFSPEPGTPAAEMPDQIPSAERRRRRDEVMLLQQRIARAKNRQLVGQEMEVLVESRAGAHAVGRSYRDGPEVDGTVRVLRSGAAPGSWIRVRITGADAYDLTGIEVDEPSMGATPDAVLEAKH